MIGGALLVRAPLMILGLGLVVSACAASIMPPERGLRETVTTFNEDLRWRRYRQAAQVVPARYRDMWIQHQEKAGKGVRITEYEVRPAQALEQHAWVDVDIDFHRYDDFTVKKVRRRQEWRVIDNVWMIVSDREVPREEKAAPQDMPTYDFGAGLESAPDKP